MMLKIVLSLAVVGLVVAVWAKAQTLKTGYAIQNVQTGKNLRPFAAGKADGNRLVLYDHHNWQCMTWQLQRAADDTYRIRNVYTGKTFQPTAPAAPGVTLCQQPLRQQNQPQWELLRQPDDTYLLRLAGTALYLTSASAQTNSAVLLRPLQATGSQRWRLVSQRPWF